MFRKLTLAVGRCKTYIPIRARKTGVVSFTASKKVFIMTITSVHVLNSIFIVFLF